MDADRNSAAGRMEGEQTSGASSKTSMAVGSDTGGVAEDTPNIGRLSLVEREKALSERYLEERDKAMERVLSWSEQDQTDFVLCVLSRMCHHQHGQIDSFLKPMLQRDFITLLPGGLAESVLSLLDARSLAASARVNRSWRRAIAHGMLWRKLIERKVRSDPLWQGLSEKRGWKRFLFISKEQATFTISLAKGYPKTKAEEHKRDQSKEALEFQHLFYCELYPQIVRDIDEIENNWRTGRHNLQRINCESENSKGVYCLQYDDDKIISGLRDNTIKIWRRSDLSRVDTLTGHTGSVLCLQYDDRIIASGSSDATVRIWDVDTGAQLNTLIHHCEAVLHLRFQNGMLVTCSKDRSIAVWCLHSPKEIDLRRVLVGHRAAVNVVDFDQTYIVSASGDRTIKVWSVDTCEFVRTLNGHKRGIACLQYRDRLIVSGSSDFSIRLWDIECGTCLRVLEGHEELVRCIRFDSRRIVSGAYDGKIKVWDLQAALDLRVPPNNICIKTLSEHTGRVFRLQFDEFQIVSSSHDDTILIWDFLNATDAGAAAGIAGAANGNALQQQPALQPIAPAAFPAPAPAAGHHVQRPMPVHPGGGSPLIPQMPGLQLHGSRAAANPRNLPPVPPLPLLHHHRCAAAAEAMPGPSSQLQPPRVMDAVGAARAQGGAAPGPSTSRAMCSPPPADDADVMMEAQDEPNIADSPPSPVVTPREVAGNAENSPSPPRSSRDQEERDDE